MPEATAHNESDCIFCRIVKGELPCAKLYEDDKIIAFLDINPVCPGHALVLPKAHFATLMEFPADLGNPLMKVLRKLGGAIIKSCNADGLNCLQNNHSAAGQMVFHAHWHLIPRFAGDGLLVWPAGKYESQTKMAELAASIVKSCA